jgi:hypothetical protein
MPPIESRVPQVNSIRIARIAKTYPDKHLVDLVFLDDGGYAVCVPVVTPSASQKHGFSYLPKVDAPPDGPWSPTLNGKKDTLCAVAWTRQHPVVVGFLFPLDGDMSAGEDQLKDYHPSGFKRTIDADGTMTLEHPGRKQKISMEQDGIHASVAQGTSLVLTEAMAVVRSAGVKVTLTAGRVEVTTDS